MPAGASHGSRGRVGPAAGSGAAVSALQGLVAILQATLGDAKARQLLQQSPAANGTESGNAAADTLAALQQLALPQPAAGLAQMTAEPESSKKPEPLPPPDKRKLHAERTAEWLTITAARVHDTISVALPPLQSHPRAAVRAAAAEGAMQLLDSCGATLAASGRMLLEAVLAAAQDSWPSVADPARAWLTTRAAAGDQGLAWSALEATIVDLTGGLPAEVRRGDEAATLHARRLTTALQAAPADRVATDVLGNPARRVVLLDAFCGAFEFERAAARLLLHASFSDSGPRTLTAPQPQAGLPRSPSEAEAAENAPLPASVAGEQPETPAATATANASADAAAAAATSAAAAAEAQHADAQQPPSATTGEAVLDSKNHQQQRQQQQQQGPKAPLDAAADCRQDSGKQQGAEALPAGAALPRMPMGLAYVGSRRSYEALATLMRETGRLAATADSLKGSSVLRGLIDGLLQRLHSAAAGRNPLDTGWQGACASAVAVASEVLFGASPAWQTARQQDAGSHAAAPAAPAAPAAKQAAASAAAAAGGMPPADGSEMAGENDSSAAHPTASGTDSAQGSVLQPTQMRNVLAELPELAGLLLEACVGERLWGLPTHGDAAAATAHGASLPSGPLLLQLLGENAALVRVLLEGVGAAARALGTAMAQPGTLLCLVLLPTLERIGDPCAIVAAAADAAVASICSHCGYHGLGNLIAANSDYVVDGICTRLRSLDANPRAPQLLAALLQRSGASPQLLPLLGEPASAALRGLSITARRARPAAAAPFLQALTVMCGSAAADAATVAAGYRTLAAAVNQRLAAAQEAEQTEAAAAGAGSIQELSQLPEAGEAAEGGLYGPPEGASIEEIQAFFVNRQKEKQMEAAGLDVKVEMTAAEWDILDGLGRRMRADAKITAASADVAAQLLYSSDLKVALLAVGSSLEAFRGLADASAAADIDSELREVLQPRGVAEPVAPEVPRLLPAVHVLWQPLMAALKDARAALAERAAAAVAEVAAVGGAAFLARRWRQEAWPALKMLLSDRSIPRPSPEVGPDERVPAAATAQRGRLAALCSIAATANADASRDVLAIVTADIADAVAACLADRHPPSVRMAASEALLALTAEDSDAVWLTLTSLAAAAPSGTAPAPPQPPSDTFPAFRQVLPQHRTGQSAAADGTAARAAALLSRLPASGAVWHVRAPVPCGSAAAEF